eukprot:3454770-Prymnesium_polylepis.1
MTQAPSFTTCIALLNMSHTTLSSCGPDKKSKSNPSNGSSGLVARAPSCRCLLASILPLITGREANSDVMVLLSKMGSLFA